VNDTDANFDSPPDPTPAASASELLRFLIDILFHSPETECITDAKIRQVAFRHDVIALNKNPHDQTKDKT
jgi:hypothetical protein